jgi:hypothetical protein
VRRRRPVTWKRSTSRSTRKMPGPSFIRWTFLISFLDLTPHSSLHTPHSPLTAHNASTRLNTPQHASTSQQHSQHSQSSDSLTWPRRSHIIFPSVLRIFPFYCKLAWPSLPSSLHLFLLRNREGRPPTPTPHTLALSFHLICFFLLPSPTSPAPRPSYVGLFITRFLPLSFSLGTLSPSPFTSSPRSISLHLLPSPRKKKIPSPSHRLCYCSRTPLPRPRPPAPSSLVPRPSDNVCTADARARIHKHTRTQTQTH